MAELEETVGTVRHRFAASKSGNDSLHHHTSSNQLSTDRQSKENNNGSNDQDETPQAEDTEGRINGLISCQLDKIMTETGVAYEQLQEQFTTECKSLLHSAMSTMNRVHTGYDESVADTIKFCVTPRPQEKQRETKKIFKARESVLTEILRINHVRSVYNAFAAILAIFSVQTLIVDYFEQGRIVIDFSVLLMGFGKFSLVISIWLCMLTSTISLFPAFNLWNQHRASIPSVIDKVFLLLYILYVAAFFSLPVWALIEYELPAASTVVITAEQMRLWMKAHSFIRENVPRVLSSEDKALGKLKLAHYLYFLFAPTLIYRDEYPRTKEINWKSVAYNMSQVVLCIFYTYYIFVRFCIPTFSNFNREHISLQVFISSVFSCMLPSAVVLMNGFFGVLHCWLNAWAEIMRFSDRLFYKDWWNSTSFTAYYRDWNIVVHDWLYNYVYQEIYRLLGFRKQFRWLAMYSAFFVSAVFHEYIIALSLRFVYPVMFVCFAILGVSFIFVTNPAYERFSNIFIWAMLFVGNGILMSFYCMEYFARRNCQPIKDTYVDYMIPRSWFCEQ